MTVLVNPYERALQSNPSPLQDPLALRQVSLSPGEQRTYDELTKKRKLTNLQEVELALAAGFVFHQLLSSRLIQEKLAATKEPSPSSLKLIADIVYQATVPKWLGIAAPALLAGYQLGIKEVRNGTVPQEDLEAVAEAYAKQLGEHLFEVSTEALLSGFNAQVNRKIPAARAAQQVAKAYGVPPKAMNALIMVWNSEDPKRLTSLPVRSERDARATALIHHERSLRGSQVGAVEAWAARTQAKQLVWMYGMQHGTIPQDAKRTWVTARDEKVCKSCGPLNRVTVPVGEEFDTAAGRMWTPPLHINCRCDLVLDYASQPALVAKAYDPQEKRDEHGRWATGAKPTKTKTLYAEVHAPSIAQDIQTQLDAFKQSQALPDASLPSGRMKLPDTKLPSLAKLPSMTLPSMTLPSVESPKADTQQRQKLGRVSLPKMKMPQLKIPAAQRSRIADVLYQLPPDTPDTISTEYGDWVRSERPIVFILPDYEVNADGTFLLDGDHYGIELGERAFSGLDSFYNELDQYWNDEVEAMMENFFYGEPPTYQVGDTAYEISPDDIYAALEERVNNIPLKDSTPIMLDSEDGQTHHPISAYALGKYLGLDDWIEEASPTIAVVNHVLPNDSERTYADRWLIRGSFKKATEQGEDLDIGHLPHTFYYAEPTD